jgi:hypothetical protein
MSEILFDVDMQKIALSEIDEEIVAETYYEL